MQIIGVPTCPYCRKRVNLIRTWSLKKHGEYRCPKCRGISNIYLSPLVYIFALIAIALGFVVYFFEAYISDTLDLNTIWKVFIPFAGFFFLSLFGVYLKKPVIKRVRKTTDGRYFDDEGNELHMSGGRLKPTGRKYAEYAADGTGSDNYRNYVNDDDDIFDENENAGVINPRNFVENTLTSDAAFGTAQFDVNAVNAGFNPNENYESNFDGDYYDDENAEPVYTNAPTVIENAEYNEAEDSYGVIESFEKNDDKIFDEPEEYYEDETPAAQAEEFEEEIADEDEGSGLETTAKLDSAYLRNLIEESKMIDSADEAEDTATENVESPVTAEAESNVPVVPSAPVRSVIKPETVRKPAEKAAQKLTIAELQAQLEAAANKNK